MRVCEKIIINYVGNNMEILFLNNLSKKKEKLNSKSKGRTTSSSRPVTLEIYIYVYILFAGKMAKIIRDYEISLVPVFRTRGYKFNGRHSYNTHIMHARLRNLLCSVRCPISLCGSVQFI